jgi:hypothetical protein
MTCLLCGEKIETGWRTYPVRDETGKENRVHWECMLRQVLGGIGHLENHQHWCVEKGDPDGGRTYRTSALEVAQWVEARGDHYA